MKAEYTASFCRPKLTDIFYVCQRSATSSAGHWAL